MKNNQPVYPDNILRAMPEDKRKAMGKAGMTKAECEERQEIKSERDLQNHMRNLLNQRGLMFYTPSMTKRSPMPQGWPDFTILLKGGRVLFVEAKTLTGQLSDDQEKWHAEYWAACGSSVRVVRTMEAFRDLLNNNS